MEDNIHIARIANALERIVELMENSEKREINETKKNIKLKKEHSNVMKQQIKSSVNESRMQLKQSRKSSNK